MRRRGPHVALTEETELRGIDGGQHSVLEHRDLLRAFAALPAEQRAGDRATDDAGPGTFHSVYGRGRPPAPPAFKSDYVEQLLRSTGVASQTWGTLPYALMILPAMRDPGRQRQSANRTCGTRPPLKSNARAVDDLR